MVNKQIKLHKKQRGDALLSALLAIFVFSLFVYYVIIPQAEQESQRFVDAKSQRDIEMILEAVISHRTDESQSWFGTFPADIATLVARGYLPGFTNANTDGQPYTLVLSGRTFSIVTNFATAQSARRQGALVGNGYDVTNQTLTVFGSAPGDELSHIALLPTDGTRNMRGDLGFDTGADINLNDNAINDVRLLDARTDAGDGRITTDAIDSDTAVFRDLRVIF